MNENNQLQSDITIINELINYQMISFLFQLLLELVKCVRFNAYWLSTALFDYAEDTSLFIHLIFTNVNMMFNTVNWSSLEVRCRIKHPTRVNNEIDWNRLKY